MRRLAALLAFLLFATLAAFSPSPVLHAQEAVAADAPDYAAWESVATRGEAALEEGRASDDALAALRAELVEWRARFVAAQETNADRIETVRSQIEALGPLPAEGETETEEVAARRAELGDLLTELQAPARRASEAFSRAEGLIREIDAIIRDRQTEALLERETSPLNPSVWPAALSQLRATFSGALSELTTNWANPVRQATLRNDLPITLALLIVAVVMLIRGRIWMERLTASIFQRFGSRVAGFFISTGQVIVPTIGILLLTRALDSTGLLGLRGGVLLRALPVLVLSFFLARWIGERVFPKVGAALLDGDVPPEVRARFRWFAGAIGLTIGLRAVFATLAEQETYAPEVEAAVLFPFTVILGLLLFRLGRSLFALSRDIRDHESVGILGSSAITFLSRAAMVLGVLGPLLGAAGYGTAAGFTVLPAALTLGLFGIVTILSRLLHDVYALVTGSNEEETRAALIPTLMSFAVVIAALPGLALIWGARVTDLTELWTRMGEGFSLGETRITPGDFLTFLVVFAIGYGATRVAQSALKTAVLPKTRLDAGGQNAVVAGIGYVGIFLAAIIAITSAGINLSSLAIVAGALSVGVGFGLQNVVQNFVAGIILLVERPIGEGDWIEVGGNMGIVKSISVRSTRIETFDRTDVIIPNADFISGTVTNWTRGSLTGRLIVNVGVAYGTDTRKVDQILREIAEAHPMVVIQPAPMILFAGFGADSLDFEIRVILRDVNYILSVKNDLNHEIARRFAEEGIEIPFAQRDIWLRNPEALSAGRAGAETGGVAATGSGRSQLEETDMPGAADPGGEGDGR